MLLFAWEIFNNMSAIANLARKEREREREREREHTSGTRTQVNTHMEINWFLRGSVAEGLESKTELASCWTECEFS